MPSHRTLPRFLQPARAITYTTRMHVERFRPPAATGGAPWKRPAVRAAATLLCLTALGLVTPGCTLVRDRGAPGAALERADEAILRGAHAEAAAWYRRVLQQNPREVRAHIGLAQAALGLGEPGTALRHLAAAEQGGDLSAGNRLSIQILRGRACNARGDSPVVVWSYLYPVYAQGSTQIRQALHAELAAIARAMPPETAGRNVFVPPAATATWHVRPRTDWGGPSVAHLPPLGKPWRITVHHSGHAASHVHAARTSRAASAAIIKNMHGHHVNTNGWKDLGYHFVIDPRGETWEGRPLAYLGAHAGGRGGVHNTGNIGIVLVGDFQTQEPSRAQIASLEHLVDYLRRRFGISASRIMGHCDLRATACPGKHLLPHVRRLAAQDMSRR